MRAVRALAAIATASLLLTAVLAHEGHKPVPSKGASVEGDVLKLTEAAQRAAGIRVIEVSARALERTVAAPVVVHAAWDGQAFASSPVAGTVDQVVVRPGDRVEGGQVLAWVRSEEVAQIVLERRQVAERVTTAKAALDRFTAPVSGGGAGELERIRAEATLADAEILLHSLESRYRLASGSAEKIDAAEGDIALAAVRAPLAGIVTHVDTVAGGSVEPLVNLVEVVDRSRVWAEASLVEAYLADVHVGAAARVTFAGGIAVEGRVDWIAPVLDPATRMLHAVVSLRDPEGRLVEGLAGVARIVAERTEQAQVVPTSAVVRLGLDSVAFVELSPGAYRRTPLVLGATHGREVEVLEGLGASDRVIVDAANEVQRLFPSAVPHLDEEVLRRTGVTVEPVTVRPLEEVVRLPARLALALDRMSLVASRIPSRLESVTVKPGDHVEAGQPVATIVSPGAFSAIVDARLAARRLELRRSLLQRLTLLADRGAATPKDIENARADVTAAEASLAGSRRRLALLGMDEAAVERALHDDTATAEVPLRSPIAGEVLHLDVERGRFVYPEDHIVEVADLSVLRLAIEAPEEWATRVLVGSSIRVELPALPGLRLEATLRATVPRIHGNARTVTLLADVPNPERRLPSGTAATATLVLAPGSPGVVVPRESVLAEGLRRFLIRVEDGEAFRTEIEIGRSDDRFVEVVRGVYPGESVVARGAERVRAALSASR